MQIRVQALKPVLQKYGPTILTGLASAGVVLTAHLTRRAVLKNLGDVAEAVLFEDDSDIPVSQTVHRIDRQNWKNYIPPAIAAVCTIGCLVGANQWHLSKEGALAAAVALYKTNGEELEKKFKEKFGEDAVKEAKKEIAKERSEKNLAPWDVQKPDKIMIWEPYSEQYFYASQKDLLWVEIMANKMLAQEFTVKLDQILALYGLRGNAKTKNLGWSYDDESFCELASYYGAGAWIDLCPQTVTNKDGSEYFQMEYGIHPNDISEVGK